MRRIFLTFWLMALSFTSQAEIHTIVDAIKECKQTKRDTIFEQRTLLQEMIQFHKHSALSSNAKKIIQFYENMSTKNWELIKENCREFSFNIFMLATVSKKSLFPLLTSKGFPLNESFLIRLNDVHKKIIYDLSYNLIKKGNCTFPKKTTKVDYRPYLWLLEISKHPDFIRLPMEVINICRDQINQKVNRYSNFVSHPTCNGFSYWLNGNLGGTFKGEWVEKDLFCDAYRSYQFLEILSTSPSYHLNSYAWKTITETDLFEGDSPAHKCKLYYLHPKRETCYPKN